MTNDQIEQWELGESIPLPEGEKFMGFYHYEVEDKLFVFTDKSISEIIKKEPEEKVAPAKRCGNCNALMYHNGKEYYCIECNDPIREVYEGWIGIFNEDELPEESPMFKEMWNAIKKYCEENK